MIEKFMVKIIHELGPIGLLIIGLYWIMAKPLWHMAKSLQVINHNTTTIAKTLKKVTNDEDLKIKELD